MAAFAAVDRAAGELDRDDRSTASPALAALVDVEGFPFGRPNARHLWRRRDPSFTNATGEQFDGQPPQLIKAGPSEGLGWEFRVDTQQEKKLRSIDVSNPGKCRLIKKKRPDRATAARNRRPCPFRVGRCIKGIAPDAATKRLYLLGAHPLAGDWSAKLPRVYCTHKTETGRPGVACCLIFESLELAKQSQMNMNFLRNIHVGFRITKAEE